MSLLNECIYKCQKRPATKKIGKGPVEQITPFQKLWTEDPTSRQEYMITHNNYVTWGDAVVGILGISE